MSKKVTDNTFQKRIGEYHKFTCYLAVRLCQRYYSSKATFTEGDIKSEALLALCVAAKSYDRDDESKFKAYLAAIIVNRVKRFITFYSTPVTLKYSTHCSYKNQGLEDNHSSTAKRIRSLKERNIYCEENVEQSHLIDDYYRKNADSEKHLERIMKVKRVRKAISNISSESQELIKTVYYQDMSPYELAKEMESSAVTVYQKRKRAFKEVQRELAKDRIIQAA